MTTMGMAFVQECVCGYQRRDPSNWSKHRKACKALRVIEPLKRENERLRTLHQDATERAELQRDAAVQALQEQYSQLAAKVEKLEELQRAIVPSQQTTIQNQTVNNTINII